MRRESFPRGSRLTRRRDYLRVQQGGERVYLPRFLVMIERQAAPSAVAHVRLGVTVTRKVGSAVMRNRIKRLVREVFRRRRGELRGVADMVWVAKRSASSTSFHEVWRGFDRVARRLSGQER
ncbi:MAG: ribonuclease P protein component [Myxococcales bacterium FL481]|nr:MAG: ribonuclease P protein component [Myxococcales bacterium FL481]